MIGRAETNEDIVIPLSVLTDESVEIGKNILFIANAKAWGLEIARATPDIQALRKLLEVRYHQDTDDIEHEEAMLMLGDDAGS